MNKKLIITSSILLWLTLSYFTSKGIHWLIFNIGANHITPEDIIGGYVGSYLIWLIIILPLTADFLDKRKL